MTPRVTVILPTFQRATLVPRALRSVLRQTYGDLQVCVYDNASSDETGVVVAEFAQTDDRVRYHRQPVNIGSFDNFAYGMARVETEFFSFLSDDDVLYPRFLEAAVAALERNPDALMFAGSTLELSEGGRLQYAPVALWPREGRYEPPEGARAMLGNKHPTWTAVLFRRAAIERIGLIDPQTGACSDLDYELQIAARFPIVVSYTPCAAFVRHPLAYSQREDTSVISGYRRMAEKFAADQSLEPSVRAEMARSLARQTSAKLVEIAAKSAVRCDDAAAKDALGLLAREPLSPLVALARLAIPVCLSVPLARKMLQAAERMRMRRRAAAAKRLTAKTLGGASGLMADLVEWRN